MHFFLVGPLVTRSSDSLWNVFTIKDKLLKVPRSLKSKPTRYDRKPINQIWIWICRQNKNGDNFKTQTDYILIPVSLLFEGPGTFNDIQWIHANKKRSNLCLYSTSWETQFSFLYGKKKNLPKRPYFRSHLVHIVFCINLVAFKKCAALSMATNEYNQKNIF